jgi:hypothetical protein
MKLKYIDVKREVFFNLSSYKGGKSIKTGDVIEVNDVEVRQLLKLKNGKLPRFEKVHIRAREESVENGGI